MIKEIRKGLGNPKKKTKRTRIPIESNIWRVGYGCYGDFRCRVL